MKLNTYTSLDNTTISFCKTHCKGETEPACTDGGHCVTGILQSRQRPNRRDMLEWLTRKNTELSQRILSENGRRNEICQVFSSEPG